MHTEMPKHPKYPQTEPLRQFLDPSRQPILPNLPHSHLCRVLPLLKYIPTDPCTGLAVRFTQANIRALLITDFAHRPWDWGENIDDTGPNEKGASDTVRNAASIPLELFAAEATGDKIQHWDAEGPNRLWNSTEGDEWHTRTVLGSEMTFQREWVDSRVLGVPEIDDESSEGEEGGGEGVLGRRKSVSGAGGREKKKRKASTSPIRSDGSDDEIQIIEAPVQLVGRR